MENKFKILLLTALCFSAAKSQAQCVSGNCEDGYGVYVDDNGNRYSGFFKNGEYSGEGTLIFYGGDVYIGSFKNDMVCGKGTYIWGETGEKYFGHWEDGNRQGIGTSFYEDGTASTDIWNNDEVVDDDIKEGCLNGDCKTGYGVCLFRDGSTYEGYWRNSYFSGQGVYNQADGSRYEGEFLKGWYNGYGTLTSPDGTQKQGLWEKGRYIGELNTNNIKGCVSGNCENGYGLMVYDDKSAYLGDFKTENHMVAVFISPLTEQKLSAHLKTTKSAVT